MITLVRPSMELVPSYFEFVDEMKSQGEFVWEGILPKLGEPTVSFVERLLRAETLPEEPKVPETTYWATIGDQVVGRIALRHFLNDNLKEFGGHIGYEVRPSYRKRGIAKEMLGLVLATPKAIEIGRLLVTCDPDNVASSKTILANGGIFTKSSFVEKWQRQTNYYWINVRPLRDKQ